MKTIKELDNDIAQIQSDLHHGAITAKAAKTKLEKLKFLKLYLEASPSEESIQKQIDTINETIDRKAQHYNAWCSNNKQKISEKNPRPIFEKEIGITELRSQLSNLNYLL